MTRERARFMLTGRAFDRILRAGPYVKRNALVSDSLRSAQHVATMIVSGN